MISFKNSINLIQLGIICIIPFISDLKTSMVLCLYLFCDFMLDHKGAYGYARSKRNKQRDKQHNNK